MLQHRGPGGHHVRAGISPVSAASEAERYAEQDPAVVAIDLAAEAELTAAAFAAVEPSQLERRGLRSDSSAFTVDSLARYFLHDALHHVWDVRPRSAEASP